MLILIQGCRCVRLQCQEPCTRTRLPSGQRGVRYRQPTVIHSDHSTAIHAQDFWWEAAGLCMAWPCGTWRPSVNFVGWTGPRNAETGRHAVPEEAESSHIHGPRCTGAYKSNQATVLYKLLCCLTCWGTCDIAQSHRCSVGCTTNYLYQRSDTYQVSIVPFPKSRMHTVGHKVRANTETVPATYGTPFVVFGGLCNAA